MRLLVSLAVLSIAAPGAGIRAQGIVFGQPSVPSEQPTVRIKSFSRTPVLPKLQTRDFNSSSAYGRSSLNTCPMPVARGDLSGDPMPMARGGSPAPMPVARSGCWNPLDQDP
jgi:hypothetical protein